MNEHSTAERQAGEELDAQISEWKRPARSRKGRPIAPVKREANGKPAQRTDIQRAARAKRERARYQAQSAAINAKRRAQRKHKRYLSSAVYLESDARKHNQRAMASLFTDDAGRLYNECKLYMAAHSVSYDVALQAIRTASGRANYHPMAFAYNPLTSRGNDPHATRSILPAYGSALSASAKNFGDYENHGLTVDAS